MTNLLVILLYGSLFTIFVVLLVPVFARKAKTRIDFVYLVLSLLVMAWILFEVAIHSISDPALIAYLYTARLGVIVFVPIPFFYLVVLFFNIDSRYAKLMLGVSSAVSVVFAVCAFGSFIGDIFWLGGVNVVSVNPLVIIEKTAGLPYYLLLVYTQIPILGVLGIILAQRRKLPIEYRSSTRLLGGCLVVYAVAIVAFLTGITKGTGIDSSLIGISAVVYVIYFAIISKKRADYLSIFQGDVFNHLEEAILIINEKDLVADVNQSAQELFDSLGISLHDKTVSEIKQDIEATSNAFLRSLEGEGMSPMSSDLYITDGEYPLIYEIQKSPIESSSGANLGSFLILTEVTRNRLFIERLQDLAGVDVLTELPNRFSYEQTLTRWDRAENLPLSIIIGDLNGLKKLNDGYGHHMGDALLRDISTILRRACPENGFAARIGGDEFVMLLKNHDQKAAEKVIVNIRELIETTTAYPELMSIALGSATKIDPAQNINMLYAQADAKMYDDKREEARQI
ncbi:MAG: diguanylate cyclase domain-containing protein [Raoultibacter sp.]